MSQVAVAMSRAPLGADHPVAVVAYFIDIGGDDGLGEARPSTAGIEFVGRGEQGLAADDIDVDAGLLIVQQFPTAGTLGAAFLGDMALLGRPLRNGFAGLEGGHSISPLSDSCGTSFHPRGPPARRGG